MALTAWVLLDLTALDTLRQQVDQAQIERPGLRRRLQPGHRRPGRAGLPPGRPDRPPRVSRRLVAFVHLVQGKEAAGQERAWAASCSPRAWPATRSRNASPT
jgi:hypothetical protein